MGISCLSVLGQAPSHTYVSWVDQENQHLQFTNNSQSINSTDGVHMDLQRQR